MEAHFTLNLLGISMHVWTLINHLQLQLQSLSQLHTKVQVGVYSFSNAGGEGGGITVYIVLAIKHYTA